MPGASTPETTRQQPWAYYGSIAKVAGPAGRWEKVAALSLSMLLPWGIFTTVCGTLSFSLHFDHAGLCWFLISLCATLAGMCGVVAYLIVQRRWSSSAARPPSWYVFMFLSTSVALVLGSIAGSLNYSSNMLPFYQTASLNLYTGVDPSKMRGEQLLDAGRAVFIREAALDISRSAGFRNGVTYCVAPITAFANPLGQYDFWAVGVDCCTAEQPDFNCYDKSTSTIAGMRLLEGQDVANYMVALQQAEATFHIQAGHPLFFQLTDDPVAAVNRKQDRGYIFFFVTSSIFLAVHVAVVVFASLRYWKLNGQPVAQPQAARV